MIQLARLEGFYWVARTGGYARAARAFPYPITEPAVHQQVKKLEAELGTTVFVRIGKDRMMLTDAGRALYEFSAPFFEGLTPLVQAIEQGRVGGQLRIDAAALEISQILPRWIKRLRRELPDVRVVVKEIEEPDYGRLRAGLTDLIVDYQPSPPRDVRATRVGTYYGFLVVPRELLPASRRLELKRMASAPFASFPPGSSPHALQLGALREAGCTPSSIVNASSVAGILGFVQSGLCYSIVPWGDARGPRLPGVSTARLARGRSEFAVTATARRADGDERLARALACALGIAVLALGCGSARNAERPASSHSATARATSSQADCTAASGLRARARAHRQAGRRLAALRGFEDADTLCPSAANVAAAEVRSLREELKAKGAPSLEAGISLLESARRARTSGDAPRAALLEEQAVVVLEQTSGERLSVVVPSPGPRRTELFFTPDSQRLLERHRDGLWLRRRDTWYPEFVSGWGNDGEREDARLSGDGRSVMVPVDRAGGSQPQYGRPTFAAAIDAEPGPGFGRERARIGVNGTNFGYSLGGAWFVAAEPIEKEGRTAAHEELVVADATTFAIRHRIPPPEEGDPSARIERLALGKRFALAQWPKGLLSVVNLATGSARVTREATAAIQDAPFSPDERFAVWRINAPAARPAFAIFETETGKERRASDPSCELEFAPRFDPKSTMVAIGGSNSVVCVFELATGRLVRKFRAKTTPRDTLATPSGFTPNGAGIYVSSGQSDYQLFDVKSGRLVPTGVEHPMGALRAQGTNGILIGYDGKLATIGAHLEVSTVTPSLAGKPSVMSARTQKGGGIALKYGERWVVVDPKTGAARPHSLPLFTDLVLSDDETLLLSVDHYGPFELLSEAGERVPGAPTAYGNLGSVYRDGDELVFRGEEAEWHFTRAGGLRRFARPSAPPSPCGQSMYRDPTRRFSVILAEGEDGKRSRLCDEWTGARSASFPNRTSTVNSVLVSGDGSLVALAMEPLSIVRQNPDAFETLPTTASPLRFVGKNRLVTTGEMTNAVEVWDLARAKRVAALELEERDPSDAFALSPDDRRLLVGRNLWDLTSGRKVGRVPDPVDAAEFWNDELLASVSGARLTIYRLPSFAPVLGLIAARDSQAALAFAFRAEPQPSVQALQTFGDAAPWDTTLPCAVANVGVPFRLCREVYGTTGLFETGLPK